MQGLSTTQAGALTATQLGALATATFDNFTSTQLAALTLDADAGADDDAAERGFDDFAGRADGFATCRPTQVSGLSATTLNNLTDDAADGADVRRRRRRFRRRS